MSLDRVQELLKFFTDHAASEKEVIDNLSQGLDFKADPETLAILREHGATEAILEAVQKYAKKDEPKGAIALRCVPAECKLSINGKPAGATLQGHFVRRDLKPGETYTVDIERDGYLSAQEILPASVEPVKEVVVHLDPTEETKILNGKRLHAMMIRALGDNLKTLQSITGTGSATTYKNGKPVVWDFEVTTAPPHLIEMRITSSMGGIIYACSGHRCEERRKGVLFIKVGTKLPAAAATDLESSLSQLANLNLVSILEAINSPDVRISARSADPKTEERLNAEGRDFTYVVTLGPDSLPTAAEYKPRGGLGGATITFGAYTKLADCTYPKHTTIALQGAPESGFEVRLDKIELGSKLRASDFRK